MNINSNDWLDEFIMKNKLWSVSIYLCCSAWISINIGMVELYYGTEVLIHSSELYNKWYNKESLEKMSHQIIN